MNTMKCKRNYYTKLFAFVLVSSTLLFVLSFDFVTVENESGQYQSCDDIALKTKKTSRRINLSEWMRHLPHKLTHVPLNRLALPGSHDSGSYWFNKSHPIAPDQPSFVQTLGIFLKPLAVKILGNWALTQRLDIAEQLHAGVRYLDIRTAYLDDEDDFFIVHGLYGHRLVDIFTHISSFLRTHPKEVLVLHFQYCWDMDRSLHLRYWALMRRMLGDKIYPRPSNVSAAELFTRVTLNDMWMSKKQIILVVGDHCPGLVEHLDDPRELWPPMFIYSQWFKTDSISILINNLTDHVDRYRNCSSLNVFQAILTPRRTTVAYDPFGSLEKYIEDKHIGTLRCWLHQMFESKKTGINIVMFDFIDTYLTGDVVRLNRLLENDIT